MLIVGITQQPFIADKSVKKASYWSAVIISGSVWQPKFYFCYPWWCFNQKIMLRRNVLSILCFSILLWRLFEDQILFVLFNFFQCSRNLGNMVKIFLHVLSISKKLYEQVFRDKLWGVLQEHGVGLQQWCVVFCHHLFFSLFSWIGLTNAIKLISEPRLEIAKSVASIRWWFGSSFFYKNWPPARITANSFAAACDTARTKIITAKTDVLDLLKTLVSTCCKWMEQQWSR